MHIVLLGIIVKDYFLGGEVYSVRPRESGDPDFAASEKKDWAPAFAGANGVCQPGIHTPQHRGYGFRARGLSAAPRNDEEKRCARNDKEQCDYEINASHSSSLSTVTPCFCASASFEPAPGPATT